MPIRPDNIQTDMQLPNYINIGTVTGNIVISGTVTNGTTTNFTITLVTSSNNTRFDMYGKNTSNGNKQLLSSSNYISNDIVANGGIYQHISTELVQFSIAQTSITVVPTISIFNGTGGNINLVAQTITISVVEYQIPY